MKRILTEKWHRTDCSKCLAYDDCTEGENGLVCGKCFEAERSQAFAEIAEETAKRIALHNLAYNLVFLAFGVLIGSLVTAGAAQEVFGK